MTNTDQLMPDTLNNNRFDEEWEVVLNSGGKYSLSKKQAQFLLQEIAMGNRGIIPFETFVISIPYIVEFYRIKRFLKNSYQLSERTNEEPYKPISPEKWEKIKKEIYQKIGKL